MRAENSRADYHDITRHDSKGMMQEQYLMLTQNEVWGSQVEDLVWMACFADGDIHELAKKADRDD